MVSSSFKAEKEMLSLELKWIPDNPTVEHYLWALGMKKDSATGLATVSPGLTIFFRNSIIVSVLTCVLVLVVSLPAGFSLSRFIFKGRRLLSLFLLSTTFFPLILMLVPIYITLSNLKLIDTYLGLVLVLGAGATPFCVWMMKGFVDSIPYEVEESAMIDGCTRVGAFVRITVPLIMPGIVATVAYTFMFTWGAYMEPLIICSSNKSKQLSIALTELIGFYGQTNWGGLMAGSTLAALPIIVIFMLCQRWLVQGMAAGAVKQ